MSLQNDNLRKRLNIAFSENVHNLIGDFLGYEASTDDLAIVSDGYHLGPISIGNHDERSAWIREHLGIDSAENFNLSIQRSHAAFKMSSEENIDLFAWVDVTSDMEYANFLHWIDCCNPQSFFIVKPLPLSPGDLSDESNDRVPSLTVVRNSAKRVEPDQLETYVSLWRRLKSENAAFRLFDKAGEFRSLSIDEFDDVLIGASRNDWQPASDIVLRAMNACWSSGRSIPGDLFFFKRLAWLAEHSFLDIRGDSNWISNREFRLYEQTSAIAFQAIAD